MFVVAIFRPVRGTSVVLCIIVSLSEKKMPGEFTHATFDGIFAQPFSLDIDFIDTGAAPLPEPPVLALLGRSVAALLARRRRRRLTT